MDITIRRILVALDASPHSDAALEAAVKLAALLRAEVIGLFVEDIMLIETAELPLIREVSRFTRVPRQVSRRHIEHQYRAQARRLEERLRLSAERARVTWSFHTARGTVTVEIVGAAAESDLITLGKTGRSPAGRKRIGSTVRAILQEARGPALILREGMRLRHPVVVLYDGSPSAQAALSLAAQLSRVDEQHLTVLIQSETPEARERLQAQAIGWVRSHEMEATYRRIQGQAPDTLAYAARQEEAGILVLPHSHKLTENGWLDTLLNVITCPVMVVK